jgi:hypothetical protein
VGVSPRFGFADYLLFIEGEAVVRPGWAWMWMSRRIYESLLEKNAEDVKGGAGQYFTPQAADQSLGGGVRHNPGESRRYNRLDGRLLPGGS